MEISPTTSTVQSAAAQPTTGSAVTGSAAALASDFETFLKMLTAQARYQDPLEPLDSSEYAAQLAQFSMVEQQVLTNDTLKMMQQSVGVSSLSTIAGLVGMEVRSTAPVQYDGSTLTVVPNPAAAADKAFLVVRDASGAEVSRQAIPKSTEPILWDGRDEAGAVLPPGQYSFTVESQSAGKVIDVRAAETYATVVEAQMLGGETVLILSGGAAVSQQDISAIRQPASP